MKNKILVFIIGVLVGAILATGVFYIYENSKSSGDQTNMSTDGRMKMRDGDNFKGGTPPNMKNGEKSDSSSSTNTTTDSQTTPPEKPADDNGTLPEKPADDNNAPQSSTTESNT